MNVRLARLLLLALLTIPTVANAQTPSSPLARAKAAYGSAAYEDALALLAQPAPTDDTAEVQQYRALCLLALARTAEAQQVVDRLVLEQPLYRMNETDVSPRLVAMFHEARQRVLPGAAKTLYTKAKANFEAKKFDEALVQLNEMLAIVSDSDVATDENALTDLKMLGEGFLRLAEAGLNSAPKPAPAATAAAPAPEPASTPEPAVFTAADKDVRPPVEISRSLPAWIPPNTVARNIEYQGLIEIVIDEEGLVSSARVRASVSSSYDAALVAATKTWRYRPAMKDGEPVKFRKMMVISLTPSGKSGR